MSATRGFYSVIQYCPDASRLEAANIGVLLLCPEIGFVRARTAAGNDRVQKFFGRESFDPKRLNAAKAAIERRVEVAPESFRTPDDLVRFIETRGNDIMLTHPRPTKVSDPEQELNALYDELVGGRSREKKRGAEIPALDQIFRRPSVQNRVLFNQRVEVPVIGRTLKVPYAFRNGVLNLVKPQRFVADEREATFVAMRLAIEGDLLDRHRDGDEERKLIVVSVFQPSNGSLATRNRVDGVLQEYKVRVVHEEQLDDFAAEVERDARL